MRAESRGRFEIENAKWIIRVVSLAPGIANSGISEPSFSSVKPAVGPLVTCGVFAINA